MFDVIINTIYNIYIYIYIVFFVLVVLVLTSCKTVLYKLLTSLVWGYKGLNGRHAILINIYQCIIIIICTKDISLNSYNLGHTQSYNCNILVL